MKVLIVEDDVRLAAALAHILKENNYTVDTVHNGEDGVFYAQQESYDVIVLDVMLPKKNGYEVVAELRRAKLATPVLLLTARDGIPDKIKGLDSGADDYMTKPFAPAELMAHLRALTRRQGEVAFEELTAGDLTLQLNNHELICEDRSINLSYKEFLLARALISNAGITLAKDALIEKIWGAQSNAEDNNLEAYVSFLRKKLRFLESGATIETLRSVGYRLQPSE